MMKSDPYLARIESFNLKNGGGVTITKVQNGYNLYLTATDAPIARLNPVGSENYHHLTYEERCQIEALQKRGHHHETC